MRKLAKEKREGWERSRFSEDGEGVKRKCRRKRGSFVEGNGRGELKGSNNGRGQRAMERVAVRVETNEVSLTRHATRRERLTELVLILESGPSSLETSSTSCEGVT